MKRAILTVLLLVSTAFAGDGIPVKIHVDAAKTKRDMRPIWAFFGYDEPNYTYMKDGRKLLSQISALSPVPVYVRAHNLMTTGDGTPALKWGSTNIYKEDAEGKPHYDWTIVDRIFDTYVERGMKPLVEIGFMPEALSIKPQPYQHKWAFDQPYKSIITGWAYPPKDYKKWSELVYQWVRHCIDKYGRAEVESWLWELWNEPNTGYWQGTPEEYYKLYDYTADAVKRALPAARIGGPHAAGGNDERFEKWLRGFLDHVVRGKNYVSGATGSPIDFLAFHAKGAPKIIDGHVQMGISNQLAVINREFSIVASYPELRDKPIIIGESDPEGCAACSARVHPQNAYRNGTMYSSYTAASFARKYELAALHKVNLMGAVTWAFEFENQPWFDGFRDLATNGVEKPVLNVFRMYGMMRGRLIEAESSNSVSLDAIRTAGVRGAPDVGSLASREERMISIMVWNYHDDELPGPDADIELTVQGFPVALNRVLSHQYRIDRDHSNSYEAWKRMGSPQNPTREQIAELERSASLKMLDSPEWINVRSGSTAIRFTLPRQGVSLIQLSW